jgi:putative membrane protein
MRRASFVCAFLLAFHATAAWATDTLTDAQIAKIAVTADKAEVDSGKYAASHAKNKEVQRFAEDMVKDHGKSLDDAKDLAKAQRIEPETSPMSASLEKESKQGFAMLKKESAATFDRAYLEQQVSMHQQVLDTLDNSLIPNAKSVELRAQLQQTRSMVESHLEHAKQLQSSIRD